MVRQDNCASIKSLADAAALIKEYDAGLHRHVVAAKDLRFVDDALRAQDRRFLVDGEGLKRLCDLVAAPAFYVSQLPSALRSQVLAHHLAQADTAFRGLRSAARRHAGNVTVVARNGTLVGFARADLTTLRAADVLDRVAAAGETVLKDKFDTFIVHGLTFRGEALELDLVTPALAIEPRPGDVVRAGVRVTHSLLGDHPTGVETFLLRLACMNGAVRRECIGERARRIRRTTAATHDGPARTLDRVEELARDVFRGLEEKLASVSSLAARPFSDEGDVRRFIDGNLQAGTRLHSRRLLRLIETAWRSSGAELSEYGVWNAFTQVATHAPDKQVAPTIRGALERLGGIVATRALHMCPHCFRALNQG